MKFFAVLDTNVLVSALLKEGSAPWQVLKESLDGCIIPLLNAEILNEYKDVLLRKKFGFAEESVRQLLAELPKRALLVNAIKSDEQFPDPDDAVFYEVVMAAPDKDNSFLVTGNLKHFPEKRFVVTPREMLDLIQNSKTK